MKYFKKLGIYKASNVSFNPSTKQAYSYNWWRFVDVIKGKVVFNNYRYSVSTSQHQSKIRNLMKQLGIKIDFFIPINEGLQCFQSKALLALHKQLYTAEFKLNRKGIRNQTKLDLLCDIKRIRKDMEFVKKLGAKRPSKIDLKTLKDNVSLFENDKLRCDAARRAELKARKAIIASNENPF